MNQNDITYLYDGTWEGLLLLVFWLFSNRMKPFDIQVEDQYKDNLLYPAIKPVIDSDFSCFKKKFSRKIWYILFLVFLTEESDKELVIYYFLINAFKYGESVIARRNLNCVNKALNYSRKVTREAHKWKGFLRFSKMEGEIYYAKFHADANILGILANHFSKRMSEEYFVIQDVGRNLLCFYDKKKVVFCYGEEIQLQTSKACDEHEIEELWRVFFQTIAIKERKNLRCQMNFMPKKYWRDMLEMEDYL